MNNLADAAIKAIVDPLPEEVREKLLWHLLRSKDPYDIPDLARKIEMDLCGYRGLESQYGQYGLVGFSSCGEFSSVFVNKLPEFYQKLEPYREDFTAEVIYIENSNEYSPFLKTDCALIEGKYVEFPGAQEIYQAVRTKDEQQRALIGKPSYDPCGKNKLCTCRTHNIDVLIRIYKPWGEPDDFTDTHYKWAIDKLYSVILELDWCGETDPNLEYIDKELDILINDKPVTILWRGIPCESGG